VDTIAATAPKKTRRISATELESAIADEPRIRHPKQFEIKMRYSLPREQDKVDYDLSVYFFLPPSLGLSRDNYGKNHFYEDLQSYIRLKTPETPFSEIHSGHSGALSHLNAAALRLQGDTSDRSVHVFEYHAKLFCCVVKSSLREYCELVESTSNSTERLRLLNAYRTAAMGLRTSYHALGPRLRTPNMPPSVKTTYDYTDEYLSLLLEEHTYRLVELVPSEPAGTDLRKALLDIAEGEISYREAENYPLIADASGDNELFVYRRGVLKKYVSSVLFLSARSGEGGRILEEGLFGVAAGVSMIFATAVLYITTQLYGPLTGPVFLALVISYIFKDRIKERLRVYLSRKASRWLYDQKTVLYASPKDRIGICKESVDFIDANMIPAPVAAVRNRSHMTEIESGWTGERVVRYRKNVTLYPVRITDLYDNVSMSDINDIMRVGVGEFVRHLGTPEKPLTTLVDGEATRIRGERVHHLNVILRYATAGEDAFRRYRVILNRNGIKRIDVVPQFDE